MEFENDVEDLQREWLAVVAGVLAFGIGAIIGAMIFGLSMIVF